VNLNYKERNYIINNKDKRCKIEVINKWGSRGLIMIGGEEKSNNNKNLT
jgi:hypothetical protein